MPVSKIMRKGLLLFVGGLAALALLVVLSPFWLGLVLEPVAKRFGAEIGRYQRIGYARLELTDVAWERGRTRVELDRVETTTPWLILLRGGADARVEGWRVSVSDADMPPDPKRPRMSMPRLHEILARRVVPQLQNWLSHGVGERGEISWPGTKLTIAGAEWQDGALKFRGLGWRDFSSSGTVTTTADGALVLETALDDERARARAQWLDGDISGEATLWKIPVQLSATFPESGWIPTAAELRSEQWQIAADEVGLGERYVTLSGGADVAWHGRDFDVRVNAHGEPREGSGVPPIEARAFARGDAQHWRVEELVARTPFAQAQLSEAVEFSWRTGVASTTASLDVDIDLGKQNWIEGAGRIVGRVSLQPREVNAGVQEFSFEARDLRAADVAVRRMNFAGNLRWPLLEVTRADVELDEGTEFAARGSLDVVEKQIVAAQASGAVTRAWLGERIAENVSWTTADFVAEASGPWSTPRHAGTWRMRDFAAGSLKPMQIEGGWSGAGREVSRVQAIARSGESRIEAAGRVADGALHLEKWNQFRGADEIWHLASDAVVKWSPAFTIENLRLEGASELSLSVTNGERRGFAATGTNLRGSHWKDWAVLRGPSWWIEHLTLAGEWRGQGLVFDLKADGEVGLEPRSARVALDVRGDEKGMQVESLRILDAERVLTQASGVVPFAWRARRDEGWSLDADRPLEIRMETEPDSPLWATLGAIWRVEIAGAAAKIDLAGTPRNPRGTVDLRVRRLAPESSEKQSALPTVENAIVALTLDRAGARLHTLQATVDGQEVRATGELPMNGEAWDALWEDQKLPVWRTASGRIEIPDAQMEPFARRFPSLIATQGRFSGTLELERGGKLSGALTISDAATRPLATFGVVQEVNARIELDERTVRIASFVGRVGGQPVSLDGTVTLPSDGAPVVNLNLKGERVPLARRAGLLVRADFDLRARTTDEERVQLSGGVNITDCLILADLGDLVSTGPRGVTRQPPYFAVDVAPFNHWPLDISVRSDRRIRVRTAVFKGEASARFQLSGTLGEPRAIGELTVDEGQVLFPFATFDVRLGTVRLQAADPFHPKLQLNAQARRYGYDLRMEATGSIESPNVALSSMPALDSAEVLLLVMTGQKPASDTFTTNGQQRLARVGTYVGQELIQGLGVGGDEDRLEIQTGEQISLQGRETYRIEYRLDNRWSLLGEYDEFDDYNAGVKWRVYTEGGTRDRR